MGMILYRDDRRKCQHRFDLALAGEQSLVDRLAWTPAKECGTVGAVSDRPTRLLGILLFLPVPIVLALFTRMPLGVRPSLALGVAVMITHRSYARPFARRHAPTRCLWCGGAPAPLALRLREPLGETEWRACGDVHREWLARTVEWSRRHALLLRAGIGGGLAAFLVSAVAGARADDSIALFRFAVAAAVLPLGWLGARGPLPVVEPIAVPFPVHIQALLGTASVLWLFRIVGVVWLGLALWHVAQRLGVA
jgi:hypothetical protein